MAEIYLCTEVLQDDGKTYSKTHFHVVPHANYVALQEQLAALLNNLEAADKAVARNLGLESRLAEIERLRGLLRRVVGGDPLPSRTMDGGAFIRGDLVAEIVAALGAADQPPDVQPCTECGEPTTVWDDNRLCHKCIA